MIFNFYIEKKDEKVFLTHYQLIGDKEWMKVVDEYQDLQFHQPLLNYPNMKKAVETIQKHRTIRLKLSKEDAGMYKNGTVLDESLSSEEILNN